MISYAQNFEDVVLNRVFHNVDHGLYIDIGAFDPVIHSVTKHFYDKGWSGVNVEPIKRFYEKFERDRPRDWNINTGIGSEIGEAEFYEWGDSGLSTIREGFDQSAMKKMGFDRTTKKISLTNCLGVIPTLMNQHGMSGKISFLRTHTNLHYLMD